MKRKDFLKGIGMASVASITPLTFINARENEINKLASCTLVPSETAGPYPLDLSGDGTMFRTDIRETQEGVETLVTLKIVSANDCNPIANARVDIWHCSAYGYYSGYTTNGQLGTQNHIGETWLRGIQMTDANGEVKFTTIFPGWYSGRIAHIHFQVFLSSVLQVTSQLTFPVAEKNALYEANAPYSTYGDDPKTFSTDMVFSDGYTIQLATLTLNAEGVYESYLEAAIDATSTGLLNLAPETGGQFTLNQNFPNPYKTSTTIPFNLTNASDVKIDLFDITGKKIHTIIQPNLSAGDHVISFNFNDLKIATGNYIYQLEVTNTFGVYRQCKMMTAE